MHFEALSYFSLGIYYSSLLVEKLILVKFPIDFFAFLR